MKKCNLLFSVFIMTILLSGIVSANIAPASGTSKIGTLQQRITETKQQVTGTKDKIKAEIASTTANIKNIRENFKNAIEIKIGKKLDNQKIKIANEFEVALRNLDDLIVRIESRISKMQSSNIDVSSTQTLLETAKIKFSAAQTEVTALENLLAQNIPAATSTSQTAVRKTILQNIRSESDKSKTAIKTTQKAIIDVINSLKPGLNKVRESTSAKENNSTSTN